MFLEYCFVLKLFDDLSLTNDMLGGCHGFLQLQLSHGKKLAPECVLHFIVQQVQHGMLVGLLDVCQYHYQHDKSCWEALI